MARKMVFVMDCRARGVEAKRGRVDTLVVTQEGFRPAARGVVWQYCPARNRYVPADFSARPRYTQWDTAFLAEALADYPNQLLVSRLVNGSTTRSDASGLTFMLGLPHLTSLRLGQATARSKGQGSRTRPQPR